MSNCYYYYFFLRSFSLRILDYRNGWSCFRSATAVSVIYCQTDDLTILFSFFYFIFRSEVGARKVETEITNILQILYFPFIFTYFFFTFRNEIHTCGPSWYYGNEQPFSVIPFTVGLSGVLMALLTPFFLFF